jgi:pSer/pThr/pTyr-binding forkhead associated (FHA) protein
LLQPTAPCVRIGGVQCPKCSHENPKGTEICQGCHRVKFVTKKRAPAASPPKKPSERATKRRSTTRLTTDEISPKILQKPKKPTSRRTAALAPEAKAADKAAEKTPASQRPTMRAPRAWGAAAPVAGKLMGMDLGAAIPATRPGPEKPAGKKRHLLVRVGAAPLELEAGKVFTFGRNDTCSLPIPSARVSREHAEIRWVGGKPVIADKGSANGTFVGGKPVKEQALSPGDEIEVGPFLCVYQFAEPDTSKTPVPAHGEKTMIDQGDLLGGQIGQGGLAEVLQQIDFNKKTGTLIVFSSDGQGWVTFGDGTIMAAEAGSHEGLEAIFFLLGLHEGRYSFTQELRVKEIRMRVTVTGLLLEWGRRADEREHREKT